MFFHAFTGVDKIFYSMLPRIIWIRVPYVQKQLEFAGGGKLRSKFNFVHPTRNYLRPLSSLELFPRGIF